MSDMRLPRPISPRTALDILLELRHKGVALSLRDGELHYKAPRGALSEEDILRLKGSRIQLAELLRVEGPPSDELEPPLVSRQKNGPVPLTYTQLAHWRKYQLATRPGVRQIASATRLFGRLNIGVLEKGIVEMVRRHEALRTRIVLRDGIPHQEVFESPDVELRVDDMTSVSTGVQGAVVQRAVEETILEPVAVTADRLFSARLLRLAEDDHVLILAMEHLVSDGHSTGILQRDLFWSCVEFTGGHPHSLPEISIQLADYAQWQHVSERSWLAKHRYYWKERLRGCQRLRFPEDEVLEKHPGWGSVPVRIEADLRSSLMRWCRMNRTTLVLSIFSAYAAAVLQWCRVTDGVLRYEINGRVRPEIENTIGYFAFGLNLRVEMDRNSTLDDVAKRVLSEYCAAYEHADYALLDTELPLHEFVRSPAFNWLTGDAAPQPTAPCLPTISTKGMPLSFAHPLMRTYEWDAEPAMVLSETPDDIAGLLYFPLNRFSFASMERFVQSFLTCSGALAAGSRIRVSDIDALKDLCKGKTSSVRPYYAKDSP